MREWARSERETGKRVLLERETESHQSHRRVSSSAHAHQIRWHRCFFLTVTSPPRQAVATITAANDAVVNEAERERERQLAAVSIAQEDVALIAFEMELETAVAERKLREHGGDITKALGALLAA